MHTRKILPQYKINVILNSTNHHLFFSVSKMSYLKSCNATYYDQTERHSNVTSGEHIGLSPLTGNRVECKLSAISDHQFCVSIIIAALTTFQSYVAKITHLSYPLKNQF